MTAIVGILCRDGIVIGTDSSSTLTTAGGPYGLRTIESSSKKISIIDERIIVARTGEVGLNQRFCGVVKSLGNVLSAPDAVDVQIGVQL
jgi:20S proteasome alpha/beta subunit